MNSDSNNIEEQDHVETENDVEEEDISELQNYNEEQNIENPKLTKGHKGNVKEDKNMDEDEEPIYVMTLALEQGRSEKIEIFANSDPKELAYNFCRKNNLDFSALDYLKDQITKLLEAYEKQDGVEGEGEGEGAEEEINENDDENNIEEENINEDDKEGDMNIPEIEEVQETLEMNSNENIKEVNTDNNNNNEEEYKINSFEKNNDNKEADNNDNDNNMKMDESNDKSIENNEIMGENDNFEKEGDCNNEDNEDNDSDEIVKEIDFRNIPQRQNDIVLNKNDKINQNIQSLPELNNINNDIKEKDFNDIINENIKEINKDESNKKEKEYENMENENKKEENENLIHNEEHNNEDKLNDIDFQSENLKNDIIESGEKDKNENNNDYEQENINDNYLENSNKKESEYQERESYSEKNEIDNNNEREKNINENKKDNNYFMEEMETNNNALETKNNKNNNVLLNEQEETDIGFNQKDEQFIIGKSNNNYKNKTTLSKAINKNKKNETNKYPSNPKKNDLIKNKFSITQTSSTPIIINSNSEIYNNNKVFSKNDLIEENIFPNNNNIFKTTTEYTPSNQINKNVLGLNEKINVNAKRNSYSFINDNNKNNKKISKKEIMNQFDGGRNSQSHKQYLFERNKKFKQEKEKEIISIQRQVDKIDSKKSLLKENIDINNLYDMNKYSNFNNMESSNHFRKEHFNNHIYTPSNYYNIGKVNRLMEEYNKKYSFHPIINDNYKTDLTFDERLNIFNNISKQKKEELKNNLLNIKVDENGQEYFKPKLISRQYYANYSKRNNNSVKYENENEKKMDIFNKNYLYWKKYNSNKEKLYNKYYNNVNEPHLFSKVQSTKYLNEANYKAFSNLFNELDSDQDNLITSLSMNLNNIPDNILKIIEPLLVELKEDQQTLNQEEFIKAMSKLYENISSTERRQLINEYNNARQKNPNKDIFVKNSNKNKKNYSLIKKDTDNNLNFNNISNINNRRISKKSYLYFDDNNFDNNFLSSRPKTPIYNMSQKNNRINFNFANKNNKKEKEISKINVNNKTNKLAYKHYLKVQKMMKDCNNFNNKNNKDLNNNKFDDSCFDDKSCYRNQKNYVSFCMTPKSIILDENKKFSLINDYTYNNYLKNLN